jgi:hypothetical protein
MKRRVLEVRPWLAIALAAALGCGGKSAVRDGDRAPENEAGADSGGSSGAGGSVGSGGRAGGAGSGMAAASGSGDSVAAGNGGAAGKGGAAGSAGMPPVDKCALPAPELRPCDGYPFFFHDVTTGECVPVEPSRCADDRRIFGSLAECMAACPLARPAANACDAASDCIVGQPGCCGGCEPMEPEQLTAVNETRRDALGNNCNVQCGACNDVSEFQRTGQWFVPYCGHGKCGVRDLRRSTATECDSDDDCTLREGSSCCEGCDGTGFVALSNDEYVEAACGEDFECDPCVSPDRENYVAACSDNGHCVVRASEDNPDGRLLRGDPASCALAPEHGNDALCAEPPATDCTYAGGKFGPSTTDEPMTCFCDSSTILEPRWLCVETDFDGQTDCPRTYPPGGSCTHGEQCNYGVGSTLASCLCIADESGEGSFECFPASPPDL